MARAGGGAAPGGKGRSSVCEPSGGIQSFPGKPFRFMEKTFGGSRKCLRLWQPSDEGPGLRQPRREETAHRLWQPLGQASGATGLWRSGSFAPTFQAMASQFEAFGPERQPVRGTGQREEQARGNGPFCPPSAAASGGRVPKRFGFFSPTPWNRRLPIAGKIRYFGKKANWGPFIFTPKAGASMVAKTRPTRHHLPHYKGSSATVGSAAHAQGNSSAQVSRGNKESKRNFVGLPLFRGSDQGTPQQRQISGAMVCHFEDRGRPGEGQIDLRLQTNKSAFAASTLSTGPPAKYFSVPAQRPMGGQNRSERRIFSFGLEQRTEALRTFKSRRGNLAVSGSLFRAEHVAPAVHGPDEGFRKTLAKTRNNVFCVFGRHSADWQQPTRGGQKFALHGADIDRCRHENKFEKVSFDTNPAGAAPGVRVKFSAGVPAGFSGKIKSGTKRTGQVGHQGPTVLQKNGGHSWHGTQFFSGSAIPASLHRHYVSVRQPAQTIWLGLRSPGPSHTKRTGQRRERFTVEMERSALPKTRENSTRAPFRFLNIRLGRAGPENGKVRAGILAGKVIPPHQCERIGGRHSHSSEFGKTWRKSPSVSGQHGNLLLPHQRWGKKGTSEQNFATLPAMVPGKPDSVTGDMGSVRGYAGRCPQPLVLRQGGLHPKQKPFQLGVSSVRSLGTTDHRHVCLPRKCTAQKICHQMAASSGPVGRCPSVPLGGGYRNIRKPPMDCNSALAAQIAGKPASEMSTDLPLLGFCHMVAPINQTAHAQNTSFSGTSFSGNVSKLPGAVYATSQVAPSLHFVVRKMLEEQQASPEAIQSFLDRSKSLPRYDGAFRTLWGLLKVDGIDPLHASLTQVASAIVRLHSFSKAQARNAYSAMLLVPGFSQLRFVPLLAPYKKEWNSNVERYGTFWNPAALIRNVAVSFLNWASVLAVRDRLILMCRLLCLHRSIDLARLLRTVSLVGGCPLCSFKEKVGDPTNGNKLCPSQGLLGFPHGI